jgi:hypothetical protein
VPVAKAWRQVAPRDASTETIQNRFHKQSIIFSRDTDMTVTTGQTQSLKTLPLIITQSIPLFHEPDFIQEEKLVANENTL